MDLLNEMPKTCGCTSRYSIDWAWPLMKEPLNAAAKNKEWSKTLFVDGESLLAVA